VKTLHIIPFNIATSNCYVKQTFRILIPFIKIYSTLCKIVCYFNIFSSSGWCSHW